MFGQEKLTSDTSAGQEAVAEQNEDETLVRSWGLHAKRLELPFGQLILVNGVLYRTTDLGGDEFSNGGTVFSVVPRGGDIRSCMAGVKSRDSANIST